jgi:hypothetical protein
MIRLDDGDPSGSISRAKQIFKYYYVLDDSNVEIASISLEGDVMHQFYWLLALESEHGMNLWNDFFFDLIRQHMTMWMKNEPRFDTHSL